MFIKNLLNKKNIVNAFTIVIVITGLIYNFLPALVLRENYIYTVWDNLDSTAGITQVIYNNNLFNQLFSKLPIMDNMDYMSTTQTLYLYDILNCKLGFLNAQIVTKIISTFISFFGLKKLLNYLFGNEDNYKKCIINLVSLAYTLTPCAPNRMISFASLPIAILVFIVLFKKEKFSCLCFIPFIFPLFFQFSAFGVFVCGLLFILNIVYIFKNKKININLSVSFILLIISTIMADFSYLYIALFAKDTNRSLLVENRKNSFSLYNLYRVLKDSQEHAYDLHNIYLFSFCLTGTIYICFNKNNSSKCVEKNILLCGWFLWLFTAILYEFNESGIKTGIIIIDGFNWGRSIYIMRIVWYIMFIIIAFLEKNQFVHTISYVLITLQILLIVTSDITYNDNRVNIISRIFRQHTDETITFKEFFSEDLFDDIKKDISYNNEVVVAYGFHPSVLQYNGFNTLDGYASVHSSKYQKNFRKVISPALEKYEKYKNYYDGWGGRAYLFGELDYDPDVNKNVESATLYIDVNAYKDLGGKYIISRAEISNSEELGVILINDYTNNDSIYHFYVYMV